MEYDFKKGENMNSDKLSQAVKLIKLGKKKDALPLLIEIIRDNPDDANAWSWLYACVDTNEQKKYCLEQVLRINPNNQKIRDALDKLNNQIKPTSMLNSQISQKIIGTQQEPEPNSVPRNNTPSLPKNTKMNLKGWLFGIGIILCIAIVFMGSMAKKYGGLNQIPFTIFVTMTPTKIPYPSEMKQMIPKLETWQTNINDYMNNNATYLGDYQTFVSFGETMGRSWIIEVANQDKQNIDNLIHSSVQLSDQGKTILDTMQLITPPEEIAAAHTVIIQCMQERIATLEEINIGLSNLTPIGSDHSFVGPECYSFDAAVEKVVNYVDQK
jgi:hypothetical protein